MPIDWLVIGSAWLTGLLGGVHCVAMCGGIATGLGTSARRKGWFDAALVNLGRVSGYVLAGAIAGGIGGGILAAARIDWLATGSRMLVGLVLVVAALRLLLPAGSLGFLARPGQGMWRRLQPVQRALLPADSAPKRFALGMLWGWLPCGLSTTLLAAAWLQASAFHGGLTMLAFGLGTLPLMVPLTWSGARMAGWMNRHGLRLALGLLVLLAGLLTLAAPWLMQVPAMHGLLSALGCRSMP
ncbi:sulfite exporter TauE/SafE family protein [Lysobacter pythonis]|uniref:Sulfite exporter TauE/SafE family protein n=1 Tax=Solilutibacter pythonis TaxID=2483112 RepID=A0A3M2I5V4_9GAMM|nr:sulfite exporter TauE/SafE family protein [Lysobacter pythonis]RMH93837.1 sulfite exporter TauE/SafE family protein [Lysobacter pythonis]